jgi:F-box/leucine-rich repeat protein 2/20
MPEAGGGCLGNLSLGKRYLLKGRPDLWLGGGAATRPANCATATMVAAPPPRPEPDQTLALPDVLLLRVLACLPEPHLARKRNSGRGERLIEDREREI